MLPPIIHLQLLLILQELNNFLINNIFQIIHKNAQIAKKVFIRLHHY